MKVILKASNSFSPEGSLLRMLDRDWQGNTALHAAVEGGFIEIVSLLLATWNNDSIAFQGKYDYSISKLVKQKRGYDFALESKELDCRFL